MSQLYDIPLTDAQGNVSTFADYKDKLVLVVNLASKCGHTPQLAQLEDLYQRYKSYNFVVLGFPCNSFAGQAPQSSPEFENFCRLEYGVSFPVFEHCKVNGKDEHPLYTYLKNQTDNALSGRITWNFTKFLIGQDGSVLQRFAPKEKIDVIEPCVKKALQLA